VGDLGADEEVAAAVAVEEEQVKDAVRERHRLLPALRPVPAEDGDGDGGRAASADGGTDEDRTVANRAPRGEPPLRGALPLAPDLSPVGGPGARGSRRPGRGRPGGPRPPRGGARRRRRRARGPAPPRRRR